MLFWCGLLGGVAVAEAAFGGGVAVEVEVHGVVGVLEVVGPFEVDGDGGVAGGEVEGGAGDGELEFVAVYAKGDFGGFFPVVGGFMVFEGGGCGGGLVAVDDVVEALPAGGGVLVGVDQEGHPGGALWGGDGVFGMGVEVEGGFVAGYFEG